MALIKGIDTTAITVSNMDRSLEFYCDLLGMKVVDRKGVGAGWSAEEESRWHTYHEEVCGIPGAQIQIVFLEAPDGTQLELVEYVQPKNPAGARRPISDPGVAIVPFALENSAKVVEILRNADVEIIADPVPYVLDGVRTNTTYLYDPDGNALCLFEIVETGD